jgi:phosphoribosylaminoimidazole-succinocarboxamide synthase
MNALTATNYFFRDQIHFFRGKVRDVYTLKNELFVVVTCDRISAFDHVLPQSIPNKGQILNELAILSLDNTSDIIPNWKLSHPDPQVTIGIKANAIPVEFVVRKYLTGHAWRVYKAGGRLLCGHTLPEGMKENQAFDKPIVTPSTKASSGKDEDISLTEIVEQKILTQKQLDKLVDISLQLFERGTEFAKSQGLILVDTKYEFGRHNGKMILIDEVHTPDSSRYFYADEYLERFESNREQKQLSKEFVREWLMVNGFQGGKTEIIPTMTPEIIEGITGRYTELYNVLSGKTLVPRSYENIIEEMEQNIINGIEILNA